METNQTTTTQQPVTNKKMTTCKTCGAPMAKSAKKCQSCGAKNPKKRIQKLIVLLIIVGIVFVIETTTCILQIIYYKLTKKRLFLMTPIHYHFVKLGWKETDVVKMFWFVGIVLASIAILWGVWI